MGASGSVDLVIRAGRIHALSADQAVYRSIAIRGDTIVVLAPDAGGLNHLAGTGARVIDDDSLTWLPAFYDTHNHLLEATRNARYSPSGWTTPGGRCGAAPSPTTTSIPTAFTSRPASRPAATS